MVYVYRCSQFEKNLPEGNAEAIERLIYNLQYERPGKERITEDAIRLLSQDRIAPNLYKQRSGNYRVIIEELDLGNDDDFTKVFCFRHILERDDQANYDKFYENPRKYLGEIPEEEKQNIIQYVTSQRQTERERKKRQPVPDDLKRWLEPVILHNEVAIYESEEWVSKCSHKYFLDYWGNFYPILQRVIINGKKGKRIDNHDIKRNIMIASEDKYHIVYEYIPIKDRPPVYFLYSHFYGATPDNKTINSVLQSYIEGFVGNEIEFDKVTSNARRAYPDWILCEAGGEIWHQIETNAETANLALSGEEEELLRNARLPLFINGQAGSGKSTMLFYLFAELCFQKMKNGYPLEPLFLTYNSRLLDVARESVKKILDVHPNYVEHSLPTHMIDKLFYPFQDFVLNNTLDPETRTKKFNNDNYIEFTRYKQIYGGNNISEGDNDKVCRIPVARNYAPELTWHVIRTFIKGYSTKGFLSPEEYKDLPKRDKSVDTETYKVIYEMIWEKWYKKLSDKNGQWDDQDLIRFVLNQWNEKGINKRYPVIFCDESQDFTKTEIELLLKLSAFAQYDLSDVEYIPLAFAGDPFQTLNPTGFSWRRLIGTFYDKFKELNFGGLQLTLEELKHNYRSSQAIVRFANLIQFFRYIFLGKEELKPQNWRQRNNEGFIPNKLIFEKNIDPVDLGRIPDTVIIVPSEAGEERQFAENDNVLKNVITIPHDKFKPISNIYSSVSAKGLEFDTVIIYKFGEVAGNIINELMKGIEIDESTYIKASYFFNKLYVAVTRARENLFIIDSEEGEKNLWRYLIKDSMFDKESYKEINWAGKVGYLVEGDKVIFRGIVEKDDPDKIANELEIKGRQQGDPELLYRASDYYRRIGKTRNALQCDAESLEIRQKWQDAGMKFMELGDKNKASNCFWRGKLWSRLQSLHNQDVTGAYMVRNMVSLFMDDAGASYKKLFIEEILSHINPMDETWKSIIAELEKRLRKTLKDKEPADYLIVAMHLKRIAGLDFTQLWDIAGEYFYHANNYEEAVKSWENAGRTNHPSYFRSKAYVSTDRDEKIKWFSMIPANEGDDDVIREWENSNKQGVSLLNEIKSLVFNSLRRKNRFVDAFALGLELGFMNEVIEIYKQNIEGAKIQQYDKNKFGEEILDAIFNHKEWVRYMGEWRHLLTGFSEVLVINTMDKMIDKAKSDPSKWTTVINFLRTQGKDDNFDLINKIVGTIAISGVTPQDFSRPEQDELQGFINHIISLPEWFVIMNPTEVGSAFERVCSYYRAILGFYKEVFKVAASDQEIEAWSKMRYLKVLEKNIGLEKGLGEKDIKEHKQKDAEGHFIKAEGMSKELEEKLVKWRIDRESLYAAFPTPIYRKEYVIKGLPSGVIPTDNKELGKVSFELHNFNVMIFYKKKRVTISNQDKGSSISIHVNDHNITGLETTVITEPNENGVINFKAEEDSISGIISDKLDLSIRGSNITIQFK